MSSLLPIQAPPVKRPELVEPRRTVDVLHGTPKHLINIRMMLTHGANFNDPAPFAPAYMHMRMSAWCSGGRGTW
ncbi:cyanobactin biosynthesis system PatB/AcyB/McaB family protein [Spirillospora sp. NPDC052269]